MVAVAYAVMHAPWVPQRVEWLRTILATYPDALVVADDHRQGLWPTARRAWMLGSIDPAATHVCVLQDDMLPTDGGRARLESAVAAHPRDAVSGFQPAHLFGSTDYHSFAEPVSSGSGRVWGGTVVLPIRHAREWTHWADSHTVARAMELDDAKLSAYLLDARLPAWHVHPPCWVHEGWDSSLIGAVSHPWRRGQGAPRVT